MDREESDCACLKTQCQLGPQGPLPSVQSQLEKDPQFPNENTGAHRRRSRVKPEHDLSWLSAVINLTGSRLILETSLLDVSVRNYLGLVKNHLKCELRFIKEPP